MPTVARYGQRKEALDPYPNARKGAAETVESEGGAVAQAGIRRGETLAAAGAAVFGVGAKEAARQAQEERDRADAIMHLSTMNQVGQFENDTYSTMRQTRGQAAFALPEQTYAAYQKLTSQIEGTLTNDKQRLQFKQYASERGLVMDHTIRSHVDQEITRYESEELKGALTNSQNRAVGFADEPAKVKLELRDQIAALDAHGKNLGLGPEQLEEAKNATRSATHVGVIRSLIGQEKMKQAQAYFDQPGVKEQISKDQRDDLENALHKGGKAQEAQVQADKILEAGGTLTEQLAKARTIEDAEVRKGAESYLEHTWSVNNAIEQKTLDDASVAAYNLLDATRGNFAKVEAMPMFQKFSGGLRSSLEQYAHFKRVGRDPDTVFSEYYKLRRRAIEDPAAFMDPKQTNLNDYRGVLSPGDQKGLAELQADMATAQSAKVLKFLGPGKLQDDVVDRIFVAYNRDPKAKPSTAMGKENMALREMLQKRVDWETQRQQKEQDTEQIQHYFDEIMQAHATAQGYWSWSSAYQKPVISFRVQDIPPGERKTIEARLKANGEPVNDTTILRYFQADKELLARPPSERPPMGAP